MTFPTGVSGSLGVLNDGSGNFGGIVGRKTSKRLCLICLLNGKSLLSLLLKLSRSGEGDTSRKEGKRCSSKISRASEVYVSGIL